jgi:hypothetical protein
MAEEKINQILAEYNMGWVIEDYGNNGNLGLEVGTDNTWGLQIADQERIITIGINPQLASLLLENDCLNVVCESDIAWGWL